MSVSLKHRQVLRCVWAALQGHDVRWALTGSLGLALRGLPVFPHDIDIQSDADGAYAIERCLDAYVVKPVIFAAAAQIRSHFGKLMIDGMQVEIMGEVQHRLPDGAWSVPVDMDICESVAFEDMRVPVLPLTYEQQAYRALGRAEKVALIAQHLATVDTVR